MTAPTKRPSKLLWKLFAGYAVLMVLALAAFALLTARELDTFHRSELTKSLRTQATTLRSLLRGKLDPGQSEQLDRIAKEVGEHEADGLRVTIIAVDGTVLGDSQADVARMDCHINREEVRAALETGWGESTRWSDTLDRELKYVALRVGSAEQPEGVIRVALAVNTIVARTLTAHRMIWTVAIVAMVATAAFALMLARLWTGPIRRITRVAASLSRGELTARAAVRGSDELARLARSLNEMGDHLANQLSTIDGQRKTLEALLDQLDEGVIVAGPDGRIILSNPAAAKLLHPRSAADSPARPWVGHPVEECVPQPELQGVLLGAEADSTDEVRLEIHRDGSTATLLARGSRIEMPSLLGDTPQGTSPAPPAVGRILTLTDITEIARTIQMKTDFVANASHELRTPLTAIRAAVETVLSIGPGEDSEGTKRWLRVIDRHSARLGMLVSDLLALSRLESTSRQARPAKLDLHKFCNELTEKWSVRIGEKRLHWTCATDDDLPSMTADGDLLRTVLDNLIDNAIKFTEREGSVAVTFIRVRNAVSVQVRDTGCGIPQQDQERVFERFYQVERGRSAGEGPAAENRGTGLGLSIVRHAVGMMEGHVALTSAPGEGTCVSVTLPDPG